MNEGRVLSYFIFHLCGFLPNLEGEESASEIFDARQRSTVAVHVAANSRNFGDIPATRYFNYAENALFI